MPGARVYRLHAAASILRGVRIESSQVVTPFATRHPDRDPVGWPPTTSRGVAPLHTMAHLLLWGEATRHSPRRMPDESPSRSQTKEDVMLKVRSKNSKLNLQVRGLGQPS